MSEIKVVIGFDAVSGKITIDGQPVGESLAETNPSDLAIRVAYEAGYNSGFYSGGNYFPEQSWERYKKASK